MNSLKLEYENETMDIGSVKRYFEEKHTVYYDTHSTDGPPEIKDLYGHIFLCNAISYDEKNKSYSHVKDEFARRKMFKKIASDIKLNTDLIVQIEYSMRGLLPLYTRDEVKKTVEYFEYYADWIPVMGVDERFSHLEKMLYKNVEKNSWTCSIDFTYDSPFSVFSSVCSAALVAGRDVKTFIDVELIPLMVLFEEILIKAGCSNFDTIYRCSKKVTYYDTYIHHNYYTKSCLVIFEDSDYDSAIDAIIKAAQSDIMSQNVLKHIFVQESVFKKVCIKLSERISKLQWNLPSEYKAGRLVKTVNNELEKALTEITKNGMEYIEMCSSHANEYFKPLIIFDGMRWIEEYFSNTIHSKTVPLISLQAFRTTKESLLLVSVSPSHAVSVWCQNTSICEEFISSVAASCVWVNCYGCSSPTANLEIIGSNKKTFIGGVSGLFDKLKIHHGFHVGYEVSSIKSSKYKSCLDSALELHQKWKKLPTGKRSSVFLEAANILHSKMDDFIKRECENPEEIYHQIDNAVKYLCKIVGYSLELKTEICSVDQFIACREIMEPLGTILIRSKTINIKVATFALAAVAVFGNAVIFSTDNHTVEEVCKLYANAGLPIVPLFEDNPNIDCTKFDSLKAVWMISYEKFIGVENLSDVQTFFPNTHHWYDDIDSLEKLAFSWDFLKMRFSNRKLVWSTYGETYAT